jgi:hypothetical protein
MGFEKRTSAKKYQPQDGDTLKSIADRETAAGNVVSASDIARFNWGTDAPDVVDEHLRDEMGCYQRAPDKRFMFSADVKPRGELLIPVRYQKPGLPTEKIHTLRAKKTPEPPVQFEGCCRIEGVKFEFDKSFIRPAVVDDMVKVKESLTKHPDAKIIIFGHTDKVGSPEYNKKLSERRARSVHAFITNQAEVWEEIYNEEHWGIRVVQEILKDMGDPYDPGPVDGVNGSKTKAAVKNFQGDNGLTVDGVAGTETRKKLFAAYMGGKHDIEIDDGRFMDPRHMGCSEFNPVVETEKPCEKNRRVTFFLFNEARLPNLPCKHEDLAPCKQQMKPPSPRYRDEFRCSFYDSIAKNCAAEGGLVLPVVLPALVLVEAEPADKLFAQDAADANKRWRVNHHFAPKEESLDIEYTIRGLAARTVALQIHSERTNEEIYHYELNAAEKSDGAAKKLSWNGMTTITSGDLKDRFINLIYGPYKVRLVADDGTESEQARFHVLSHGIKLQMGTYTADGKEPADAEQVKWVQFKLNELGYFAGPVSGTKDDQTKRAIRRYKYDSPGMAENDDETEAAFLDRLRKGERKRTILSEPTFVTDASKTSRAFIDHNYFYFGTDGTTGLGNWLTLTGHSDQDVAKLDQFELPLEAVSYLVSKTDPDGSAASGKRSPEGVGEVEIEWKIIDPPADLSALPTPTVPIPSHGRAYLTAALNATAGNSGDATDPQDNCPAAQGGHRVDNAGYFRVGTDLPPFTGTSAGARVFTKAYHHLSDHTNKNGVAGVLFRGTYVAGEDYILTAKLVFENQPNKATLEKIHEEFTGKAFKDLYAAKTGRLTTYRKHRVAALVNWPKPAYTVDLAKVAEAYAVAHCVLDTSYDTLSIDKVFATAQDKQEYLDLCVAEHAGWTAADVSFDSEGMYPRPLPAQGGSESARDYKQRIDALVNDFLKPSASAYPASYDFFMKFANLIRDKVRRSQAAGSIILRANFCRPVKVQDHVGIPIIGPIIDLFIPAEKHVPSILCVGLCGGVTIISNPMGGEAQERFLFAHEVGHNRYLMHHHTKGDGTSDRAVDHDTADLNCTMCYPFGIQARPGLTWNRGDATKSDFCGKCILKLRGWVVNTGLPASH